MNQGPFYESGTMTASVTKVCGRSTGTRETYFRLGKLGKWQGTARGRKEQTVWQKKGWGVKQMS